MPFLHKFSWGKSGELPEAIVSIHIRNDSLRVVKGSKEKGKIIVSGFGYKKILPQDKAGSLLTDKLKDLLKDCGLEEKNFKKLRIHSIFSGVDVCVRVLKLPLMPKEEIAQAVKAKIKEVVSYPLGDIVFDFSVLGQTQERGINKLDIVFIAVQKKDFLQHLDIFKTIGITPPHLLTSLCFCEWNLLKAIGTGDSALSLILVSIDSQDTDISVFKEGRLIFTRNIPFGDKDFIEVLKNELNITWEEAEKIKGQFGLFAETVPVKYKFSSEVVAALTKQAEVLFREIDLTAHHYYQVSHGEGIGKYILLGYGAQLKGLREFLTKKLDVFVEELRIPSDRLEVISDRKDEFDKDLDLYLPNLGAMLASPEDINLMSLEHGRTQKRFVFFKFAFVPNIANFVLIAIASLIIIISLFIKGQNIYYRNRVQYNTKTWEQLQERLYRSIQLKRQLELLEFKKTIYSQFKETSIFYPEIMLGISGCIREGKIFLDVLDFFKQPSGKVQITIRGIAQDPNYPTANFMLALEKTGYFENLSFATTLGASEVGGSETQGVAFTIKGEVKNKNK